MTLKALVGAGCAALLYAAGPAHAQSAGGGTGTSTIGAGRTNATAPDSASSGSESSTAKQGTASKNSSADKSGGLMTSPSTGEMVHPKNVTPGTYTPSGAAAPKLTDQAQTRNSRDGNPSQSATPRAANGASANQK